MADTQDAATEANNEAIAPADIDAPTAVTENAALFYLFAFVIRELVVKGIGGLARNTQTDLDDRVLHGIKKNTHR